MSSKNISIQFNPLMFLEFEDAFKQNKADLGIVLGFLCWPGSDHEIDDLKSRYDYINRISNKLKIAPVEQNLLEKVVWPLRQAKASFVLSNYIGTVSTCGFIAEMIVILLFNISSIRVNNNAISLEEQRNMFGDSFENLGQARRIKVLFAFKILDEKKRSILLEIKKIRNKYLHFFSQEHEQLKKDAKRIYEKTEGIVTQVIGQEIKEGKIILNPDLLRYIQTCEAESNS
jgi:hypothetical protein